MPQTTRAFAMALDVRTEYEKAVIAGSEEDRLQALNDAQCLGYSTYRMGEHLPPILLTSVPELKNAWALGWECLPSFTQK